MFISATQSTEHKYFGHLQINWKKNTSHDLKGCTQTILQIFLVHKVLTNI